MDDNTKDKLTAALDKGAGHAATAAKKQTGWKKWVLIVLAVAASAAALFLQQGCQQVQRVTPEQLQQAGVLAHGAWHAVTGRPCVLVSPEPGK